ncbi:MAG: hypothetical protein LBN40_05700 [Oscillospiraceae bacterium]|nr:hypothetical protein [Oscillospiraceae bacterium]
MENEAIVNLLEFVKSDAALGLAFAFGELPLGEGVALQVVGGDDRGAFLNKKTEEKRVRLLLLVRKKNLEEAWSAALKLERAFRRSFLFCNEIDPRLVLADVDSGTAFVSSDANGYVYKLTGSVVVKLS